ncbi:MAG: peptidase S24 [Cyanobium sp.]|uniref:LexA family protein n=1 Tax=Synechococcus sp. CS-1333 TaxID=2848638 RepID=UPI000DBC2AD5|nr:translesion error-prone DNA polymerase V autoproteolytic subunit [Synechococcus sp. CS-1333]MCT0209645.1 translesion error-prone DNA polymerase V autoproteolytic subunit [Synechococcus sp. CS-1333]PZV23577.1 MAG: peptidase S24 [Cyanobium sp.]
MPAQSPPDPLPLPEARSRPEPQSRPAAQAQSPPEPQPLPRPLRQCRTGLLLPLAGESVAAGFPSPADDYVETGIDLNEQLIARPSSTFFLRVSGDSMVEAGIHHGDLLIVDRSVEPRPGRIVVAVLEGAFTLKRLVLHRGRLRLEAAHPAYPPLALGEGDDTLLWGVAIHVIHPL